MTNEEMLIFRCITSEKSADCDRVLKMPAAFQLLEERIETMRREKQEENWGRNLF